VDGATGGEAKMPKGKPYKIKTSKSRPKDSKKKY